MIEKRADYVYGDNNSEVIKFLDPTPSNGVWGLEKTASYDKDLQDYITKLERENGYLYAIVNALSAGEYYGPNRNGDYFPEEALKKYHKTFEEHGHVYKHHQNKDPKKAMGKVIFSNYNDKMKRVELVVKLKEDHPDVINVIKELIQGRLPKTSMGCKVPYDTCSITKKRARTRSEYSHYLKNMMGAILKDGRRVYAENWKPKFFDLSLVTIPADPISGFMASLGLEKVARKLHLPMEAPLEKTASQKESPKEWLTTDPNGIIKATQGNLSQEAIEKLAKYPLNEVLSTFVGLRILPKKEDFQKLALYSIDKKDNADLLEQKGIVFDCSPDMEVNIPDDVGVDYCNEKIAEEIKEEIPGLSLTKPNIINRILEKEAAFIPLEPRALGLNPNSSQDRVVERSFINRILFDEEEQPKLNPIKDPFIPMFALGTLYAGYAKIFGSSANSDEFTKFVGKHPWLAPVAGGAIAYGIKNKQEKEFKDSPSMQTGHVPGTPYNEYTNPGPGLLRKEAGVPQFLGTMAVATPLSYYQSAKLEEKVQRGEPISGMENVLRKHPLASAFTGSVVGRSLYKQMGASAKKLKKGTKEEGAMSKWFKNKGLDPKTRETFEKRSNYMNNLNEETINLIYNELTS